MTQTEPTTTEDERVRGRERPPVPTLSAGETLAVLGQVVAPVFARGVIIRRPPVLKLAQMVDTDERAVARMRELQETYGPGPVQLNIPRRDLALVLSPDDVKRVLADSPETFAVASLEKRGALSHFQPHGVLASHGPERQDRRRFNEEVLQPDRSTHDLAGDLLGKVLEEADSLSTLVASTGALTWDRFAFVWWRMVRRVTLGDAARDDHALTDFLAELRAAANWSFIRPRKARLRRRFLRQLAGHLDRAEPGSLAALVGRVGTTEATRPEQQVPQWLFAFDAAAWATFRALALIGSHPAHASRIRDEVTASDLSGPHDLPFLRACILESLRLWPTTPLVLRDTTRETTWDNGVLPAGTGIAIFAPLFHRDPRLPYADRFAPEVWLQTETDDLALGPVTHQDWPLIPFSAGPAACPGRNLVLLTASTMVAAILERHDLRLEQQDLLDPEQPLPGTLSPFTPRLVPTDV